MSEVNLQPSGLAHCEGSANAKTFEKLWKTRFWNVRLAHPDQADTKCQGRKWARDELKGTAGEHVSLITEVKHGQSMLAC